MLFAIGTRVKFLHSRDKGVVTALLDNGMVNVLLDGTGLEIPVFIEDLIRYENEKEEIYPVKAKVIPGKQSKVPAPPPQPSIESQYTILKSFGIQLAFDPVSVGDAQSEHYDVYLLNDTPFDVLYSCTIKLKNKSGNRQNGKLASLSYKLVDKLLFDQLNDSPVFDIECWRITTEGTGSRLFRQLRIKPKQFFTRLTTAPLIDRQVHLFKIFENLRDSSLDKPREEDLRTYTQRKTQPVNNWEDVRGRLSHDIIEYAEFIPEIDLHIEKLINDSRKLNKSEILRIQLSRFEAYMNQAIRLGVERVFIIHGIGEGRLRDAIASQLIQMPEVKTFKNEFHARYGWGATEVVLL